jgi:FMN phosphatase YigB (HAD superfamily)
VSMPSTAVALALQSQSATRTASAPAPLQLGFLSFDLDDTLFPTHQVVEDANEAMIQHMRMVYQCDTTLNDFLATSRSIRNQGLTTPMTYTELRKRAIRQELLLRSSRRSENDLHHDLDSGVNDCFQTWLNERHAAAERCLFPDAVEMLQSIKTTHFPNACIAAITNGRGNPLEMSETLTLYFDFCVSGEDANVFPNHKPHSGIYEIALSEYQQRYPLHSLLKRHDAQQPDMSTPTPAAQQDQQQQHIWCHVGDCLGNDVGASASCGAYAVWLDLERNAHYKDLLSKSEQPESTTTVSSSSLNQSAKCSNNNNRVGRRPRKAIWSNEHNGRSKSRKR